MVMIKSIRFHLPDKNGRGYVGKYCKKYVLPKFKVLEPQKIEVALIDRGRFFFAYKPRTKIVDEIKENSIYFYKVVEAGGNIVDKNEILVLSFSHLYNYDLFDLDNHINFIDKKINNVLSDLDSYIHSSLSNDEICFIKRELKKFANIQKEKLKDKFKKIENEYKKYIELKDNFIKFVKEYVKNDYNVNYSKIIWGEEDSTVKSSEGFPKYTIKCPKCFRVISSFEEKEDIPKLIKHCGTTFFVKSSSRWWDEDIDWGLHSSDGEEYYSSVVLRWIEKIEPLTIDDYIEIVGGAKKLLFEFYKKELGEKWELINSEEDFECKFEEYISSKDRKVKIWWNEGVWIEGDLENWEIKLFSKYF